MVYHGKRYVSALNSTNGATGVADDEKLRNWWTMPTLQR